jgi:prevent-host-death family protein
MRSANIAELRNRLTQYLREVRAGEEIVVRDRQRAIAKIVPLTVDDDAEDAQLVAAGLMRKAQRPLPAAFWRARRAAVTMRAAAGAVSEDRTDR